VSLATTDHTLKLVQEHVDAEANHTLDDLGIAKNARQEKFKARDEKIKQEAENARMLALYKEHVLGEKAPEDKGGFVPLGSIGGIKPAPPKQVNEPVFGD
jgi:tetraether lipid synthase